jgi:hypothetical protein
MHLIKHCKIVKRKNPLVKKTTSISYLDAPFIVCMLTEIKTNISKAFLQIGQHRKNNNLPM